ncbi:MAG: DUF3089 domain-containing protein [Candidatus Hydrogenedens sp.]|nr:DUF3089 domain-containing protein [Candidatus Hydrogenedens sp.]
MKRWKKLLRGGVALLMVLVFASVLFRGFLTGLAIDATVGAFDPAKAPPPPDYALESSWASLPGIEDPSDRLPDGLEEMASPARELVDVFYIHPTGFAGTSNWNAALGDDTGMGIPTSVMLAAQASAFNGCGQVYAPQYREANLFAFMTPLLAPNRTDGYQALDLAYEDVARAFDYFLEHYSKGRPFIIASHSQGTHHALRLLGEKVEGTQLVDRLIAAYVIGYGVPKDYFGRVFHDIRPCESPTQTGCIITWDTASENHGFHVPRTHRYPDGWEYSGGKERLCINPLTWTSEPGRAPASAHRGALKAKLVDASVEPDRLEFLGLAPEYTWAECHDGQLWIADQRGTLFYDRLGIYHLFDVNLFWLDIRENARLRAETWLHAHGQLQGGDAQTDDALL